MSTSVHHEVVIPASPSRVYEALMDSKQHAEFTGNGECRISREPGGEFSCHGGDIEGRNIELREGALIVQAWRPKFWDAGVYSVVKYALLDDAGGTKVVLDHTGIPEDQQGHLDQGWHVRYWEPLKKYFAG